MEQPCSLILDPRLEQRSKRKSQQRPLCRGCACVEAQRATPTAGCVLAKAAAPLPRFTSSHLPHMC